MRSVLRAEEGKAELFISGGGCEVIGNSENVISMEFGGAFLRPDFVSASFLFI